MRARILVLLSLISAGLLIVSTIPYTRAQQAAVTLPEVGLLLEAASNLSYPLYYDYAKSILGHDPKALFHDSGIISGPAPAAAGVPLYWAQVTFTSELECETTMVTVKLSNLDHTSLGYMKYDQSTPSKWRVWAVAKKG